MPLLLLSFMPGTHEAIMPSSTLSGIVACSLVSLLYIVSYQYYLLTYCIVIINTSHGLLAADLTACLIGMMPGRRAWHWREAERTLVKVSGGVVGKPRMKVWCSPDGRWWWECYDSARKIGKACSSRRQIQITFCRYYLSKFITPCPCR